MERARFEENLKEELKVKNRFSLITDKEKKARLEAQIISTVNEIMRNIVIPEKGLEGDVLQRLYNQLKNGNITISELTNVQSTTKIVEGARKQVIEEKEVKIKSEKDETTQMIEEALKEDGNKAQKEDEEIKFKVVGDTVIVDIEWAKKIYNQDKDTYDKEIKEKLINEGFTEEEVDLILPFYDMELSIDQLYENLSKVPVELRAKVKEKKPDFYQGVIEAIENTHKDNSNEKGIENVRKGQSEAIANASELFQNTVFKIIGNVGKFGKLAFDRLSDAQEKNMFQASQLQNQLVENPYYNELLQCEKAMKDPSEFDSTQIEAYETLKRGTDAKKEEKKLRADDFKKRSDREIVKADFDNFTFSPNNNTGKGKALEEREAGFYKRVHYKQEMTNALIKLGKDEELPLDVKEELKSFQISAIRNGMSPFDISEGFRMFADIIDKIPKPTTEGKTSGRENEEIQNLIQKYIKFEDIKDKNTRQVVEMLGQMNFNGKINEIMTNHKHSLSLEMDILATPERMRDARKRADEIKFTDSLDWHKDDNADGQGLSEIQKQEGEKPAKVGIDKIFPKFGLVRMSNINLEANDVIEILGATQSVIERNSNGQGNPNAVPVEFTDDGNR